MLGGGFLGSSGGGSFLVIPWSVSIDEVNRKKVRSRNDISAIDPVFNSGLNLAIANGILWFI
jgi:hypothetical protein